jgi:hypothetical protein
MKNWFSKNYKTLIISAFLIPIVTVALVSISHVTKWYGISNPLSWAIYLSIGIEIAALSALAAISADMGKKVYFPFGIVTLIQFIGNIYFAYSYIDITSQAFISWVELVSPLLEYIGVDPADMVGHKRFLAFFAGGMLPIISLSFLHMLVKFTQSEKTTIVTETPEVKESPEPVGEETPVVDAKDIVGEVSRVRLKQEDLDLLEKYLNRNIQPKDKEPEINEEEDKNEIDDVFLIEDHLINNDSEPQVTEEPQPVEEPQIVEEPQVIEEPQIIEEPQAIEEPQVVEEPQPVIDEPQVIEEPQPEQVLVVNEPEVIEEPQVVEPQQPIEEIQVVEEEHIVEETIVTPTEVQEYTEEISLHNEEPVIDEPQVVEELQVIDEPIEELPNEEEKKN